MVNELNVLVFLVALFAFNHTNANQGVKAVVNWIVVGLAILWMVGVISGFWVNFGVRK